MRRRKISTEKLWILFSENSQLSALAQRVSRHFWGMGLSACCSALASVRRSHVCRPQSIFAHVHAAGKNDSMSSPPPGGEICDAVSTKKLWILFSENSQLSVAFVGNCGILILYNCVVTHSESLLNVSLHPCMKFYQPGIISPMSFTLKRGVCFESVCYSRGPSPVR